MSRESLTGVIDPFLKQGLVTSKRDFEDESGTFSKTALTFLQSNIFEDELTGVNVIKECLNPSAVVFFSSSP